ncbi:alpha/beta hydrolase [Pusillimonas sp.]|uniref:alpha/beta fold hydrolase n=1 Tax=Pusillimonas sp. TaxID=3040095 RepID=UPI0029A223F3|nr:alpha/beta hydrolase [Pusillimonas sp.]MDX3894659.1 alpha/beta hydrolase [Pusillimonas sp.]
MLDIHYADQGPRDGQPVFLLHGWPDSPHAWLHVARTLNQAGLRTVIPYLRGFGPTRFRAEATARSGQITALAQDVLDLADALGVERFSVVGHDWGARTAYALAALAPRRIARCVALSVGYGGGTPAHRQAQQFWYQWYFATPQGEAALAGDRRGLCRYLWRQWSPHWESSGQDFDEAAPAFDNTDWLAVTLHGYRHRWGLAEADPRYAELEARLAPLPPIQIPTMLIHGEADGCILPQSSEGLEGRFAKYERVLLPDVGHFPQREAAADVAALALRWLSESHEVAGRGAFETTMEHSA